MNLILDFFGLGWDEDGLPSLVTFTGWLRSPGFDFCRRESIVKKDKEMVEKFSSWESNGIRMPITVFLFLSRHVCEFFSPPN
jgi:hypothetical protein